MWCLVTCLPPRTEGRVLGWVRHEGIWVPVGSFSLPLLFPSLSEPVLWEILTIPNWAHGIRHGSQDPNWQLIHILFLFYFSNTKINVILTYFFFNWFYLSVIDVGMGYVLYSLHVLLGLIDGGQWPIFLWNQRNGGVIFCPLFPLYTFLLCEKKPKNSGNAPSIHVIRTWMLYYHHPQGLSFS